MHVDAETRRLARDRAVGQRIAEMRTEQGMSQTELAAGLVDASFISMVEAGKRRPAIELLEDLAERLHTTLAWLADGAPHRSSPDIGTSTRAQALLAAAVSFEERFRDGVYEFRTWDVVQELRRQASATN